MPRPQVYGKRCRVVYDFAAFESPQHPGGIPIRKPSQELGDAAVGRTTRPAKGTLEWEDIGALGERDANTVLLPVRREKKPKRRKPYGIVEETADKACAKDYEKDVVVDEVLVDESDKGPAQKPQDGQHTTKREPLAACPEAHPNANHGGEEERPGGDASLQSSPTTTDPYIQHCRNLLSLSIPGLATFDEWSEQLHNHFSITKIAEASFGEVYRMSLLQDLSSFSASDESVFKIIALTPPVSNMPVDKRKRSAALKRAEAMSKPDDVANEVRLLQRMSSIPGFTNFREVRVLQGRPPQPFIKAYKAFNAGQKRRKKDASIFPDPSKKTSYSANQLWAVIEMQDAGTDLERCVEGRQCSSIWSVWDVFWQVALSLAKGEEGAEFEHRDLHLGNICVRTPGSECAPASQQIDIKRKLNFTGLETTIIDYTISRAQMPDGTTAFYDLALDSALFEGDSSEEYQYEIYRYMRSAVYLDSPMAEFGSTSPTAASWRDYHAITNLVWLHLVLYELLKQVDRPSVVKAPPRKQKDAYARWKRATDLEHELVMVQLLLDPQTGLYKNELHSASDLVRVALAEGWLDIEDVIGGGCVEPSCAIHGNELVSRLESFTIAEQTARLPIDTQIKAPARARKKGPG